MLQAAAGTAAFLASTANLSNTAAAAVAATAGCTLQASNPVLTALDGLNHKSGAAVCMLLRDDDYICT
jgi:hypothetical protein